VILRASLLGYRQIYLQTYPFFFVFLITGVATAGDKILKNTKEFSQVNPLSKQE
jgi:hypothetical protein